MVNSPFIVHELPRRIRFRVPLLGLPHSEGAFLEDYLLTKAGIERVRVNSYARSVVVEYDGTLKTRRALIKNLNNLSQGNLTQAPLGYSLPPADNSGVWLRALGVVAFPFLPPFLRAALTYYSIAPTLLKGITTLFTHGLKIEVLDATAVGLAAARGEYLTASLTQVFLSLGEYMERLVSRESEALLGPLLRPKFSPVWVERDGQEKQLAPEQLLAGDVLLLGPGEFIPVDGKVVEGPALLNQASLTGEGIPLRCEPGDSVWSGMVIEEGHPKIIATRVGERTTTAHITRFIQESLQTRSQTQQSLSELADRLVILTLGIGAAVFLLTRDPTRLMAVFLVDYSCILKLGTPIAFRSGMHKGAQQGILFKGSQAMETLANADTFIFDKTGTLTHQTLEVTDVITLFPRRFDENTVLALAASIEEHTHHPVAQAIVGAAKIRRLQHIDHLRIEHIVAHGVNTQTTEGTKIYIGSRHYLEEHEGVNFQKAENDIEKLETQGKFLLYLAQDGVLFGLIALREKYRDETLQVLRQLRARGIERLVLITGARRHKVEEFAQALGFDEFYSEIRPEEKANLVQTFQQQGRRVAFVGDGLNDAPALAAAQIGIVMPAGADLARCMADVVLTQDSLEGIVRAREIGTATLALIRSNIQLAACANSLVMFGGSMGWIPPILAAALHNGATIAGLARAMNKNSNY